MWHGISRALIFVVGALLVLGAAPLAAAEGNDAVNLSIKPVGADDSYFTLTAEPGEAIDIEVELANHGPAAVTVQTYAADAYSLINGGFGVKLADEPISGATEWLAYPVETFELAAQTSTIRSVRVEIPADAKPGEYLSALVIQNAVPTAATGEGVGFQQVNRQAIAVAIELPGEVAPALVIGDVTHKFAGGNSVLLVEVENAGNAHMKLEGDIVVTRPDGAEILARPVSMETVYAGTTTLLEVPVSAPLEAGDYSVSLNLGNETLKVGEKLELAAVTVPALEAPAPVNPQPDAASNPAPAADAAPVTTQAAPDSQNAIEAWMLIAGIAAALILGAGGAILGVALMRRRDSGNVPHTPAPVVDSPAPAAIHAPVSGGSEPAVESVPKPAVEAVAAVAANPPRERPVFRQRSSTSVRNLLEATSHIRSGVAVTDDLQARHRRS